MKKLFLLTCMVLATLGSIAQTKKVAILEVFDRENKLTYSQKFVLRSNMARAIANTNGYEAYDRSDVDAIMSEHDFQRTGMVSDVEIRKLGEMTGVSLILVTEGVLLDDNKIFVSAKILNIESGRVDMTDNTTMGLESNLMQEGCNILAKKLFGAGAIESQASKYYISKLNNKSYSYCGKTLDEKAYMIFLRNNCPEAFLKYNNGRKMVISGWVALGAGLAMTGIGAGLSIVGNNKFKEAAKTYTTQIADIEGEINLIKVSVMSAYGYSDWNQWVRDKGNEIPEAVANVQELENQIISIKQMRDTDPNVVATRGFTNSGIALAIVGPITACASIPLLYFGYKVQKQSVNIYNENCVSSSAKPLSLNLTSGYNGLGLALKF